MRLAKSSHQKLESFFQEYLGDKSFRLPQPYFYVGKFSRFFTAILGVHGITLGQLIFILPSLIAQNENQKLKLPENLAAHEIAHVLQYQREGILKFIYKYLRSYRNNLKQGKKWDKDARRQAYLAIPYEIEARQTAADFVKWNERFKLK
jgi:hypothetical protein